MSKSLEPHPPPAPAAGAPSKSGKQGILVSDAELKAAFEFFDVDSTGKITMSNLKKRLGAFYKNVPAREYRFLMNNQSELTLDDLTALLKNNEITDFDPVAEAFKVYDPESTGYVDTEVLKTIFSKLDFGEISEEDIEILVRTADQDGDGKVSLEDFRAMLSIQSVEDAEAAEEYEGGDAAAMYGDSAAAASALAETEVPEAE